MKKCLFVTTFVACATFLSADDSVGSQNTTTHLAQEPGAVSFTPPKDWRMADQSKLPASVLAMVVGKGATEFPPSINLGIHQNSGTMKQFLKYVKKTNEKDGIDWKDLGTIRTQAGDASLSQLDTLTEWGPVREMQVIFVKDDNAYILTAAALKKEFSKFYKDFFSSMRSLKVNKDIYEMVPDKRRRDLLKEATADVVKSWKEQTTAGATTLTFDSESFQKKTWQPLQAKLKANYSDMSPEWLNTYLETVKKELQ